MCDVNSFSRLLADHNVPIKFNDSSIFEFIADAMRNNELTKVEQEEWVLALLPELDYCKDQNFFFLQLHQYFQNLNIGTQLSDHLQKLDIKTADANLKQNKTCSKKVQTLAEAKRVKQTSPGPAVSVSRICKNVSDIVLTYDVESASVIDEDIINYLIHLIQNCDSDPQDMFTNYLITYMPNLAPMVQCHVELFELFQQHIQKSRVGMNPESATTECVFDTKIYLDNDNQGGGRADEDNCNASASNVDVSGSESVTAVDCAHISEILPNISIALIEYAYCHCSLRNREETVRYLLEHCDSPSGVLQLDHKRLARAKKEENQRKKELQDQSDHNAALIRKYGDQVVLPKYDSNGKPMKPKAPVIFLSTEGGGNQKVRYREGIVVTRTGQKVIVEHDPRDDYDGGSRGRVKSKGKRGPGWS